MNLHELARLLNVEPPNGFSLEARIDSITAILVDVVSRLNELERKQRPVLRLPDKGKK